MAAAKISGASIRHERSFRGPLPALTRFFHLAELTLYLVDAHAPSHCFPIQSAKRSSASSTSAIRLEKHRRRKAFPPSPNVSRRKSNFVIDNIEGRAIANRDAINTKQQLEGAGRRRRPGSRMFRGPRQRLVLEGGSHRLQISERLFEPLKGCRFPQPPGSPVGWRSVSPATRYQGGHELIIQTNPASSETRLLPIGRLAYRWVEEGET